ncbi:unnamed protein product [Effrenium voratum]|nr:unnamed protein product [Effrenium voratum]
MTICMVQVEGMETASLGFFFGSQPPTSQRTEFTLIGDALACSSRLLRYAIAVRYGTLLPCTGRPLCTQPLWVLLSALSQLLSSCICWKVYKLMQLQAMEYLRVDLNIGGAGGEGRSAQPLPLIRPFQGTPHQLGEADRV